MTLGSRHLAGSVVLLVCALAYNIWVFTRPTRSASAAPIDVESVPVAATTANGAPAAVDAAQVTEPQDVTLDRLPQWPRNPFAPVHRIAAQDVTAAAALEAVTEPQPDEQLTVGSILYSAERRYARVNGRILGIGDRVGSATVVDILPTGVVVETARGRRTIETRAAAGGPGKP